MKISIDRQIAAVKREITMRRHVYPRWVAEGRLSRLDAELQIDAMEAVRETLEDVRKAERPGLFEGFLDTKPHEGDEPVR